MTTPKCNTSRTIYRIVCFPSCKIYVGQCVNFKSRKSTHLSELRNNKHRNKYLQNSWNKYGETGFFFEVLERDVPVSIVNQREKFWINHYDSFRDGFNLTAGGQGSTGKGTQCKWNGITYPSIPVAADAIKVSRTAMTKYIKCGYVCDDDLPIYKRICEWNGVKYPSIAAAAKANDISIAAMKRRIYVGYGHDSDVTLYKKTCVWNGIAYNSIAEAANANGVKHATMQKRFKYGLTCDIEFYKNMIGRTVSDETREKISSKQAKNWVVIDPHGIETRITNLYRFCKDNGLDQAAMARVAIGKQSVHKGWRCRRAE